LKLDLTSMPFPSEQDGIKKVLSYLKAQTESIEFWANKIGQDNLNLGDMLNENGIHPKYIDPFKNFLRNSQFEINDEFNVPAYWIGTGFVSNDSSFSGTQSLKLAPNEYMENDTSSYTINPSYWQGTTARLSFMKKTGKIKVEVMDAANNNASIFIYNEKGERNTYHVYDYNYNWNTHTNGIWNYGLCSITFDCINGQSIKVRITNIDDKNSAYIDTVMLSPDITRHPVLYKDGPYSQSGYSGRDLIYNVNYIDSSRSITPSQSGFLFCNNTITINLPPCSFFIKGLSYIIKNIGTGIITINGGSNWIDGDGIYTRQITSQWGVMRLVTNGVIWYII
jgi:hypothetical protein